MLKCRSCVETSARAALPTTYAKAALDDENQDSKYVLEPVLYTVNVSSQKLVHSRFALRSQYLYLIYNISHELLSGRQGEMFRFRQVSRRMHKSTASILRFDTALPDQLCEAKWRAIDAEKFQVASLSQ